MSFVQSRGLVLVVEDMPAARFLIENLLAHAGFETSSVENGAEALSYLQSYLPPSVIVLDLSMPVMNGWDFLRHQMSNTDFSSIPVVLYSGDPSVSEEKLQGTNVVAFVSKSENEAKLVAAVEHAAENRKAG